VDALSAAGIQWEIVPGVTSALAASAELGVSLTRRGVSRSVVFATPRVGAGEDISDWAPAVAKANTAALYMAAGQAGAISRILLQHGMPASTPVIIVVNVSLAVAQRIHTVLERLEHDGPTQLAGPAVLMIGSVFASDRAIRHAVDEALSLTANSR